MNPKKLLPCLPLLAAGLALAAAAFWPAPEGGDPPPPPPPAFPPPPVPAGDVDIDLAVPNRTLVYSQLYDMLFNPETYRGKTVRMKGAYAPVAPAEGTAKRYHACVISDAAACCAQGVEFVPTNATAYPDDFPAAGQPIIVQGTFDTYEEDGHRFCHVRDAHLSFAPAPALE